MSNQPYDLPDEQEDPTAGVPLEPESEDAQVAAEQVALVDTSACVRCQHPREAHPTPHGVCTRCLDDPASLKTAVVCGMFIAA